MSQVRYLRDIPRGVTFIFESADDEYKRCDREHAYPARYMRVEFDSSCPVPPPAKAGSVPIVCIDWHNDKPVGIVRWVPETERVVLIVPTA